MIERSEWVAVLSLRDRRAPSVPASFGPFRSMGFVSVIIVSALFALGLPLVSL